MKTRTYYGEYTLKHWINLIIKRNIELPEYQRSFVWDKRDVERLIISLKDGQFIPPVTIARFTKQGDGKNLILDGQQRLTSLLLFCLGHFPKKEHFLAESSIASEDDSLEVGENNKSEIIGWTFMKCLSQFGINESIDKIKAYLEADKEMYDKLKLDNKGIVFSEEEMSEFLDTHFLGFSYIVPEDATQDDVLKYFSTLFRNMNYLGKKLSPMESRKSLYYLNDKFKNFFEGCCANGSDVLGGLRGCLKIIVNSKWCHFELNCFKTEGVMRAS